jgi:hypothetical protein
MITTLGPNRKGAWFALCPPATSQQPAIVGELTAEELLEIISEETLEYHDSAAFIESEIVIWSYYHMVVMHIPDVRSNQSDFSKLSHTSDA